MVQLKLHKWIKGNVIVNNMNIENVDGHIAKEVILDT